MSQEANTLQRRMAQAEQKQFNPIDAFSFALADPNAKKNTMGKNPNPNSPDIRVPVMLTEAFTNQDKIEYHIHIEGMDKKTIYSGTGTIPRVHANNTNEICAEIPVTTRVPQDSITTISFTDGPTIVVPTLMEPLNYVSSEKTGINHRSSQNLLTVANNLFNTDRYHEQHHETGLPVSHLYQDFSFDGKGYTLNGMRIKAQFVVPPNEPLKLSSGVTGVINSSAGFDGYVRDPHVGTSFTGTINACRDSENHCDYQTVHKNILKCIRDWFGKEALCNTSVCTGTVDLQGSIDKKSVCSYGDSCKDVYLGRSTWAISGMAVLDYWLRIFSIHDLADERVMLKILGEDTPICKAVQDAYCKYYSFKENECLLYKQKVPTMLQLLHHTSGFSENFEIREVDEEKLQDRLISALSAEPEEYGGEKEEDEDPAKEIAEDEEKLTKLIRTRSSIVFPPGVRVVNGGSVVEAGLVSIVIARLRMMTNKKPALPEDAIEDALMEVFSKQMLEDLRWQPQLDEDGKTIVDVGESSPFSPGNGAFSSMDSVCDIPATMLSKIPMQRSELIDTMLRIETPSLADDDSIAQVVGWTRVQVDEYTKVYFSIGGLPSINSVILYFVPRHNFWGAVNMFGGKECSSGSYMDNYKLVRTISKSIYACIVEQKLSECDEPKYVCDVKRPCKPYGCNSILGLRNIKKVLCSDLSWKQRLNNWIKKTFTCRMGTSIDPEPEKLILHEKEDHYVLADENNKVVHRFTFNPITSEFNALTNDHVLGDRVLVSDNGISVGGKFYSVRDKLSKEDKILAAHDEVVKKTRSNESSLDRVLAVASGSASKKNTPNSLLTPVVPKSQINYGERAPEVADNDDDESAAASSSQGKIGVGRVRARGSYRSGRRGPGFRSGPGFGFGFNVGFGGRRRVHRWRRRPYYYDPDYYRGRPGYGYGYRHGYGYGWWPLALLVGLGAGAFLAGGF